jgi:hypothetical protein
MVRDQQYLIYYFTNMLIYYPVFTRIYNWVVDCDKDGINVAVALIIISNAVNESQAV